MRKVFKPSINLPLCCCHCCNRTNPDEIWYSTILDALKKNGWESVLAVQMTDPLPDYRYWILGMI